MCKIKKKYNIIRKITVSGFLDKSTFESNQCFMQKIKVSVFIFKSSHASHYVQEKTLGNRSVHSLYWESWMNCPDLQVSPPLPQAVWAWRGEVRGVSGCVGKQTGPQQHRGPGRAS